MLFGCLLVAFALELHIGDFFLYRAVFHFVLAAVGYGVYDYTYEHRKSKRGYLYERAARYRVFTEVKHYAAYTDNEYRRNGVEVSVVGKVYVFKHLKSAYRDETVHRYARAAHYAFGEHIDYRYEGRYEGYYHTHNTRKEYGRSRAVFGKRYATYRFAVSRVCATAEHRADDRTYAVAEEGVMKTRVFEKVFFDYARKVFVVGYVLSKFYNRDRYEEYRKVTDCRAVKREVSEYGSNAFDCFARVGVNRYVLESLLGYSFKESEFGIVEETLESYGAETLFYGGEINYSHTHTERAVVDVTEESYYYRKHESRADTYYERNKFAHTLAFYRGDDYRHEGEQTYEYVPKTVLFAAVVHHPTTCRTRERKTDYRKNGSYYNVRKEFLYPACADEFNNERDYNVH